MFRKRCPPRGSRWPGRDRLYPWWPHPHGGRRPPASSACRRDPCPMTSILDWSPADERAVDLIRVLAMDAVQEAGSGHPGTAMSLAPAAYLLYQDLLRHDPADPMWPGRDRFVLSCGHSSLTLYI